MWFAIAVLLLIILFILWKMFVIVPAKESFVKERLGKFAGVLHPGFHFLVPVLEKVAYKHDIREQVLDVPPQSCITKDNIQVEVDGLVYLKVVDAQKASYGINDYRRACVNLAQTTMRSEIGRLDLDSTFSERDTINDNIVLEIDKASDPWGIKMMRYEIRNITPSGNVIDTLEKQMEAERQKRAEITLATADKEARINVSEGDRQEAINISEGEKLKRINEAEGRAKEIELLATASANGIRKIAEAIQNPGGQLAVKMQIVERFIDQFGKILNTSDITVVPARLAELKGFFEGIGQVSHGISETPRLKRN